jgi:hypothetical protein
MFVIGLFFGVLVGWFASYLLTESDAPSQTAAEYEQARRAQQPAQPNRGQQGDGQRNPHASDPHGGAAGQPDRAQQSIAKVHFMKKFVAALTSKPANEWPNPEYQPLLKEGAQVQCANCHDSSGLNVEAMKRMDPGAEAVERFRHMPNFMIPLMMKWVDRLNKQNADKLVEPVTCTSCHAIDPREAWDVLPPLMVNFVSALKEKPQNKNPAANWKPLLKDPTTSSMLCASCHGRIGERMEQNLAQLTSKGRNPKYADDKQFMVDLMERWVEKLNKHAGGLLTKAVVCLDCHDTDPRR